MKKHILILFLFISHTSFTQHKKALVGGRLIDGYGGQPLKNSVIII